MSIVAIADTLGSRGDEIGRDLARRLGWEFADREIIEKAAEQFGEAVDAIQQVTEARPTLWERFTDSKRRYLRYVEATIFEMAARDRVVIVGHGSAIMLRSVRHALRVRINAPERARAERMRETLGLNENAALDAVRESDRERAARMRYLYHVEVDDPFLYDLTINSERISIDEGAKLIAEALVAASVQATDSSRADAADLACSAIARARLAADPRTRSQRLSVETFARRVTLTGLADSEAHKKAAIEVIRGVPGVVDVVDDSTIPSVIEAFPRP